MRNGNLVWDSIIIDSSPPVKNLASCVVADIMGNGLPEIVTGGYGHLLWYSLLTHERGIIGDGEFGVGLAAHDIDNDGIVEICAGVKTVGSSSWSLRWYTPCADTRSSWQSHLVDPLCNGHAHDIVFFDIDNDGIVEIIANAAYCPLPGLYIYKPRADVTEVWDKYTVSEGIFSEGISIADVTGDGAWEIVHGPDYYTQPPGGPLNHDWNRHVYAEGFREMSRTACVDITGNGRPDIVIVESEYPDGRMAWYENRIDEGSTAKLVAHPMDSSLNFAHSLQAWKDGHHVHVFCAEMAAGGWSAPYNFNARIMKYTTENKGTEWDKKFIRQGEGSHQAIMCDIDDDGEREVVSKIWGNTRHKPKLEIIKKQNKSSCFHGYRHIFLDRDKPYAGTDIVSADIDGDGFNEVVCGKWWYRTHQQKRHEIPGILQVICAADIDGDGRDELIATTTAVGTDPSESDTTLTNNFCWAKAIDPHNDEWEVIHFGQGCGDWPHGSLVTDLRGDGTLVFAASYHSAHAKKEKENPHYPEIFEIPEDLHNTPWKKQVLAQIDYGEEMVACDINGNGLNDIVAGPWVLENKGGYRFSVHKLVDDFYPARVAVVDINGNGKYDIVIGEEVLDFANRTTPWSRLAWLEHPQNPWKQKWEIHVIDKMRCPHSVAAVDMDGDGNAEIICGEHDPFAPYRSRCRLWVYKKADAGARTWIQYMIDDRFEHHDGAQPITLPTGKMGIMSHGWKDCKYVHLWVPGSEAF